MTIEGARLTRLNLYLPQSILGFSSYWIPNTFTESVCIPKHPKTTYINGQSYYKYQTVKLVIQPGQKNYFLNKDETVVRTTLQSLFDNTDIKILDIQITREMLINVS